MNDKKIINIIYVSLILPIILFIFLFLIFFFSVDNVYAQTTIPLPYASYGQWNQTGNSITINSWTNMPTNQNYIAGAFSGFTGSFSAHIKIEMQFTNDYMEPGYKSLQIHGFINNTEVGGISGNCPVNGTTAYCDIYLNNTVSSTSDQIVLQLVLTGTYFQTRATQIRVTGSLTYDESTSALNNGSFNNGVNSINNNISGTGTNIINNQNANTQSIINNQNANSQAQIDAIEKQNLKCENYNIQNNTKYSKENAYLNNNGSYTDNSSRNISEYIPINEGKTYILVVNGSGMYPSYCLYGEDKSLINCIAYNNGTNFSVTPQVDGYIRYSYNKGANNSFTGENCYNMLDKQNQTSENIENALNDSSVDDPSNALNGLNVNIGTNSVISDLLLLPVTLYQSVLNNINGTCSAFTLGTMFNHTLRMPCLNISGVIGSTIYGIIDVLISGFFILSIRKKFVDIFNHFTSLKVGGNELE